MRHPKVILNLILILVITLPGIACRDEASQSGDPAVGTVVEELPDSTEAELLNNYSPPDTVNDGRTVAERLEDASLAAQIKLALVAHDSLRLFDFTPRVNRGQVTLAGEVQTQKERTLAASVAREIAGVREVNNEIVATEQPDPVPEQRISAAKSEQRETTRREGDTPASTVSTGTEKETSSPTYHTVKSGESLWTISRKYGLSVNQLKRLNDGKTSTIRPGERLRVK